MGRAGGAEPSTVEVAPPGLRLVERDAYLVTLEQTFLVPAGANALWFDVVLDDLIAVPVDTDATEPIPRLDGSDVGFPDAFEVSLLDGSGAPAVSTIQPTASAFLSVTEGGPARLAEGVQVSPEGRVQLSLAGLATDQEVTLRFVLVGADHDGASVVHVERVGLDLSNQPPVAVVDPAAPVLACGAEVVLDGSPSSDPDGDSLTYTWLDADFEVLGRSPSLQVLAPSGQATWALVVDDGRGGSDRVEVEVGGEDVLAPVVDAPAVLVPSACDPRIPGPEVLTIADNCAPPSGITITQDVPYNTPIEPWESVTVRYTVRDSAGNTAFADVLVAPDWEAGCSVDSDEPVDTDPGQSPPVVTVVPAAPIVECGTSLTLDASASYDPDGGDLTFDWKDTEGATLGEEATVEVVARPEAVPWSVEVTDEDGNTATGRVWGVVEDTLLPVVDAPDELVFDSCDAVVPAAADVLNASDLCVPDDSLAYGQDVLPGTPIAGGDALTVTYTVSDRPGRLVEVTVTLRSTAVCDTDTDTDTDDSDVDTDIDSDAAVDTGDSDGDSDSGSDTGVVDTDTNTDSDVDSDTANDAPDSDSDSDGPDTDTGAGTSDSDSDTDTHTDSDSDSDSDTDTHTDSDVDSDTGIDAPDSDSDAPDSDSDAPDSDSDAADSDTDAADTDSGPVDSDTDPLPQDSDSGLIDPPDTAPPADTSPQDTDTDPARGPGDDNGTGGGDGPDRQGDGCACQHGSGPSTAWLLGPLLLVVGTRRRSSRLGAVTGLLCVAVLPAVSRAGEPIDLDTPVTVELGTATDVDLFEFTLAAPTTVLVDCDGCEAWLYDPQGAFQGTRGTPSTQPARVLGAGTWLVAVNGGPGIATLSVREVTWVDLGVRPDGRQLLDPSHPAEGARITYTPVVGEVLEIAAVGGESDAYGWQLRDPGGRLVLQGGVLAAESDPDRPAHVADAAGPYTLTLWPNRPLADALEVWVAPGTVNPPATASGTAFGVGELFAGSLAGGSSLDGQLVVEQSTLATFTTTGDAGGLTWSLQTPGGAWVVEEGKLAGDERVNAAILAPGTYALTATHVPEPGDPATASFSFRAEPLVGEDLLEISGEAYHDTVAPGSRDVAHVWIPASQLPPTGYWDLLSGGPDLTVRATFNRVVAHDGPMGDPLLDDAVLDFGAAPPRPDGFLLIELEIANTGPDVASYEVQLVFSPPDNPVPPDLGADDTDTDVTGGGDDTDIDTDPMADTDDVTVVRDTIALGEVREVVTTSRDDVTELTLTLSEPTTVFIENRKSNVISGVLWETVAGPSPALAGGSLGPVALPAGDTVFRFEAGLLEESSSWFVVRREPEEPVPLVLGTAASGVVALDTQRARYTFEVSPAMAPLRVFFTEETSGGFWRLVRDGTVVVFEQWIDGPSLASGPATRILEAGTYTLDVLRRPDTGLPTPFEDEVVYGFRTSLPAVHSFPVKQLGDEFQGELGEPGEVHIHPFDVPEEGIVVQIAGICDANYQGPAGVYNDRFTSRVLDPDTGSEVIGPRTYGGALGFCPYPGSAPKAELPPGRYHLELTMPVRQSSAVYDVKIRGAKDVDGHIYYGIDRNPFEYGSELLRRIGYRVDGPALALSANEVLLGLGSGAPLSYYPVAWAPDGDLLLNTELLFNNQVDKRDLATGEVGSLFGVHNIVAIDPSGVEAWVGGPVLRKLSLFPYGELQVVPYEGDGVIDDMAFDHLGQAWYIQGAFANGLPIPNRHFGRFDVEAGRTIKYFELPGAFVVSFDPHSETLLIGAVGTLYQFDPVTESIIGQLDLQALTDRFPTISAILADGEGRLFVQAGIGRGEMFFITLGPSGEITDPATTVDVQHLDYVAVGMPPLSWLGSPCYAPPGITDPSPGFGSAHPVGSTIVLQGRAEAADPTRPIREIQVDGAPVVWDASGRFGAAHVVRPGEHEVEVRITDRCGTSVQQWPLFGVDPGQSQDLYRTDVTGQIHTTFRDTTWDTARRRLSVVAEAQHVGEATLQGPVRLYVGPEVARGATLMQANGVDANGRFFLEVAAEGEPFAPGDRFGPLELVFDNPARIPTRADVSWLARTNRAPVFTSVPAVELVEQVPWTYTAQAEDPELGPLVWSLDSAPAGLQHDGEGGLSWTPTDGDLGLHTVQLSVADELGATSRQRFVLSVRPGDRNSPPVFTTFPPTTLEPSTSFVYDADALDLEGDALTYSLAAAPAGAVVDGVTGEVTWPGDAVGTYDFTLVVDDGRGGSAEQSFTLAVGDDPSQSIGAPVITTIPPREAVVNGAYVYNARATDPDGDALSWNLVQAPVGMSINPATGRVLWSARPEQVGTEQAVVTVTDGTHTAVQTWDIAVFETLSNRPPVFTTQARFGGVVGTPWIYDANADDPDGDAVVYDLVEGPAGATVEPEEGRVSWTPGPGAEGRARFVLRATDALGAASLQSWTVQVRTSNGTPSFGPVYPPRAGFLSPWTLRLSATDPDLDVLTYTLVDGPGLGDPQGMTIDARTGVLSWTPVRIADEPVTVRVADPFGGTDELSFVVPVDRGQEPPAVRIEVGPAELCPNNPITLCAYADDPYGVETTTLSRDGGITSNTAPDAAVCLTTTFDAPGIHGFTATAADFNGHVGTTTTMIEVEDCVAQQFPLVRFASPTDGDRVTEATNVVLAELSPTAGHEITAWRAVLYPAGGDPASGLEIASGTTEAEALAGPIATIDPTTLANGLWQVRVEADDSGALRGVGEVGLRVEGSFKPGSYRVAFEDFVLPLPVGDVRITRTYDTLDVGAPGDGEDFGPGWRLSIADVDIQTNGPLGLQGWGASSCGVVGSFSIFVDLCFQSPNKPHVAVVTWPSGRTEAFDFTPKGNTFLTTLVTPEFSARPGTFGTLRALGEPAGFYDASTGNIRGGLFGDGGIYDPEQFELTKPDGTRYLLSQSTGLLAYTDRFGNTTTIDREGILSSAGPDVVFERDAQGRIGALALPDGERITYGYDAAGDLVTVTDQDGDVSTFVYDSAHRLVSWSVDGSAPVQVIDYDAEGRAERVEDGEGVGLDRDWDLSALTLTDVGPDPGLTTVTFFDDEGLPSRVEQRFDGQTYVTETVFNDDFLPIEVTHPTGAKSTYVYDEDGRVVSETDRAGITTETDYDPYGVPIEVRVAGTVQRRHEVDGKGRVIAVYRGDGTVQGTLSYDDWGRPTQLVNGEGETVTLHYTGGFVTSADLPAGDTVTMTRDGAGRVQTVTRAEVGTTTYRYDGDGMLAELEDPRGQVQAFGYDARGRMTAYTDKLGLTVTYTYDEADRLLTQTNRNGETVTMTYDVAGRLASVVGPDVLREYAYDPLGRQTRAATATHEVVMTHDVRGVATMVQRATTSSPDPYVDSTWSFGHDAAGRMTSADGPVRDLTYDYDGRGRLAEVADAALGAFSMGYDLSDRLTQLSRPNGAVTAIGYDGSDRVGTMNTLASGNPVHTLSYGYDSRGYPASMTDAYGTTTYTHDTRGRLTGADHPATSPVPDESYTYDGAYRRLSWVGNPTTEVVYNDGDQLIQDATYAYAYDEEGQRTERIDRATLGAVTYDWNSLGELVGITTPTGTWRFDYDALGRRTLVEGPNGFTRTFAYDTNDLARVVYDGSGTVVASYVTGTGFGEVLAEERGGAVRYAVRDKLGTPVAWLGSGGGVDTLVPRDAYGRRIGGDPSDVVPYGYTGHAEDPTGLVWGRARYLDARVGGWLSEDPVYDEPRLSYGGGSPLTGVDPTGRAVAIGLALQTKSSFCYALTTGVFFYSWFAFELGGISGYFDHVGPVGPGGSEGLRAGGLVLRAYMYAEGTAGAIALGCKVGGRLGGAASLFVAFNYIDQAYLAGYQWASGGRGPP